MLQIKHQHIDSTIAATTRPNHSALIFSYAEAINGAIVEFFDILKQTQFIDDIPN